jgi:hypothetical protein
MIILAAFQIARPSRDFSWFWFEVDRCCKRHLWMPLFPFCNKNCTEVQRRLFRPRLSGHIYNEMSLCYGRWTEYGMRHSGNDDTCLTFILASLIPHERLFLFVWRFRIYFGLKSVVISSRCKGTFCGYCLGLASEICSFSQSSVS